MSSTPGRLTTPDLVILSLFSEKAQYGYELSAELERREVRDWAGVSRPQVYYSLRKLAVQGMIEPVTPMGAAHGPERQVYRITDAGTLAFAEALGREEWATQRSTPPFLTWLALASHAPRAVVARIIAKREEFLRQSIKTERSHLSGIRSDTGVMVPAAELMVTYTLAGYEGELAWLAEVRRVLLGESQAI